MRAIHCPGSVTLSISRVSRAEGGPPCWASACHGPLVCSEGCAVPPSRRNRAVIEHLRPRHLQVEHVVVVGVGPGHVLVQFDTEPGSVRNRDLPVGPLERGAEQLAGGNRRSS